MTAERMESDNASRQAARMHAEVKASARIAAPPRMPMPQSARESLEEAPASSSWDAVFGDAPDRWLSTSVSARAATDEPPAGQAAPPASAPPTPEEHVQRMLDAFAPVDAPGMLASYLSAEERQRLLGGLALPTTDRRADVAAAGAATALGLVIAIYVLTPLMSRPSPTRTSGYRGDAAPVSTTTRRVIDDLVRRINPPR
jgi:hypothetical protein